jgi:hypothetical protein
VPTDPAALETLLDAVHGALRAGDLAALAPLTAAMAALTPAALPKDALQRLQRKLRRNEACLQASARGLRAARRRMAEIAAARAGLQTYTPAGTRLLVGPPGGSLAQRL